MYRNLSTVLQKRELRTGQKFHCTIIFGRAILSTQYCIVTIERGYHSENGVYGYRPKIQKHFEVGAECLANRAKYSNFYRLVTAYREHAHKQANINPISLKKPAMLPELLPKKFGLNLSDKVSFRNILTTNKSEGTVKDALDILNKVYSSTMGAEFSYLDTEEEREWFAETLERCHDEPIDSDTQKAILKEMLKSQVFDNFLAIKFVSFKRYGCEGAESMMAFFHEIFKLSVHDTLKNIVMCMPHRGRLNFLTGMLKFPPEKLFRKLRGFSEFPDDVQATGDVTSHFTSSVNLNIDNEKLHVTMLYNPSHLEAVNPVSMGKTRATMHALEDGAYSDREDAQWSDKVLNLQVHGDAAYTGQGVNQECLAMSYTPHFEIGGSIHIIVNNQVGFTTPASRGRSSRYCTDLAKFIAAPVIHVNGDDPEMVIRATRIAFKYQRKFRKDVFIDFNCFRRRGHNELDDPTFTNPAIYRIIQNRQSIPDRYLENLIESNVVTPEEGKSIIQKHTDYLSQALMQVDNYIPQPTYFMGKWSKMKQASSAVTTWETGVDVNLLKFIANKSVQLQSDLDIHPRLLNTHIKARLKRVENDKQLDWATAEAIAFGSLLYQGYHVRISGQDVGRGTFSHRHAMLVNQQTGSIFIPLNSMVEGQIGKIELANSILSEEAVLGYEYGLSIESPTTLPIWEAQFGDFFNGAQIIIDTFITSGETKWMTSSGLTMLLPHGYDGAGPDHTSCRVERFLQLTDSKENKPDGDNVNIQVANPTTPAQYFHLLRRQMVRDFRKPLVIVAPKTLLRHAAATSSFKDMGLGTSFKNVIEDSEADVNEVTKVILVSGKHYYALNNHREVVGAKNVAIIRVESLCPFPILELLQEVQKYKHARTYIWSQEEPQNMGPWSFVKPRFENLCGRSLKYCGREALSTPAGAIGYIHQREAEEVIVKPFTIE
ncbi:probable 2-oxoglutarate dehydrogenase E1 component DHKTD1 homolog, mitochondrial [Cephus cinctus]|uniref:Probable 2-oxoglutarate dehydrogenase E1 component DHKTD1 homolog, mitochondrial n=1 Tax=Cephus cinctus TaxID=211228 RepID=A0AAJ7FU46_CEPCN|nr:probable 2-oxoglutarate dehydrogenase E1 component DHKTD1 homolog, mitochondrial [Cephus cinctus]XP_015608358.1 probable 2-oxoglutarate dehydrogenase E1 component DHKTD1 homolog, mitochondrial [Cephus cinctus]